VPRSRDRSTLHRLLCSRLLCSGLLYGGLLCGLLLSACSVPDTGSELLLIRQAEDSRQIGQSPLLQDLQDGTSPVRAAAARALGRIGDPTALDPLLLALPDEGTPEVRKEIIFALGILHHPDAVPALLEALDSEQVADISAEIAIALGRLEDPAALDALHGLLGSSWGLIRERAVEAMALIADAQSVQPLVTALDDPDPGVAWRAAWALEKIPGEEQVPGLVNACDSSMPELKHAAVRSLGRLGASGGIERIVELARTPHDDTVLDLRIANALGRIGEDRPAVRQVISGLLASDSFHVRVAALQAIGRARWRHHLPEALDQRGDPVIGVRAAAFDAVADCLEGRGLEVLLPGLQDDSPIVAATCLARLGESTDPAHLEIVLAELMGDGDRARRLGAASGLEAAGDRVDLETLLGLLKDRDLFVATVTASVLGQRGDPTALVPLMAALDRSGPAATDLRIEAATALGELGDDRAIPILRSALAQGDDVRLRLAARSALNAILPEEVAIELPGEDEIIADVRPVQRSLLQPDLVTASTATRMTLHTDRGQIVIELLGQDAPQMVESFAALAEGGFFDGLTFHRVVGDFVIQGGDPSGTGWGDAGYTLRSEWNPRRFERGSVGIAHSGKDTGGCQLFIAHSPQPHLDARYTIWGRVIRGMDVVDRIQRGDRFRVEIRRGSGS